MGLQLHETVDAVEALEAVERRRLARAAALDASMRARCSVVSPPEGGGSGADG